jgi:hypothetical protein
MKDETELKIHPPFQTPMTKEAYDKIIKMNPIAIIVTDGKDEYANQEVLIIQNPKKDSKSSQLFAEFLGIGTESSPLQEYLINRFGIEFFVERLDNRWPTKFVIHKDEKNIDVVLLKRVSQWRIK